MDPSWPVGTLVGLLSVAVAVKLIVDSVRDIASPYREVDALPEPSPEAWTVGGAARRGMWNGGLLAWSRITIDRDWIGVRRRTGFGRVELLLVRRQEVAAVVIVSAGFLGASIGVRGHERVSKLIVSGTNRRDATAHLERLGWPYEVRRLRPIRPFA